ncbi:MAG: hypothetical protein OEV59_03665 [Deltaproteobacteria bacterium]|nr:hypothetical protein [Deltaproteobacteria bacterium]
MNTFRAKFLASVAVLAVAALLTLAYTTATSAAPAPPKVPKVVYTIDGAINLTKNLAARNEITNPGVLNAILKQLDGAKDKIKAGDKAVAVNKLEATKNFIGAQADKHITQNGATTLLNYLTNLIKVLNA